MESMRPSLLHRSRKSAFSLIEVTLAFGLVAFALVGILGVLPIALSAGRQSVDEGRAAAIANAIFSSMRDGSWSSSGQPAFTNVYYLDDQFDSSTGKPIAAAPGVLNLAAIGATGSQGTAAVVCYAKFLAGPTDADVIGDPLGSQRRFCLTGTQPSGGADYVVSLFFDNKPAGMLAAGQANRVQILIYPVPRPKDQYRFASTVCYRSN